MVLVWAPCLTKKWFKWTKWMESEVWRMTHTHALVYGYVNMNGYCVKTERNINDARKYATQQLHSIERKRSNDCLASSNLNSSRSHRSPHISRILHFASMGRAWADTVYFAIASPFSVLFFNMASCLYLKWYQIFTEVKLLVHNINTRLLFFNLEAIPLAS